MRLNLFQYHVENGIYSSKEISKLVNHCFYTHSTLAHSKISLNSFGAAIESIIFLINNGFIITTLLADYKLSIIPISSLGILSYCPSTIKVNDSYTGTEVTSFLNKHYDVKFSTTKRQDKYDQILEDFLNHRFLNENVPSANIFDFSIAVLDKTSTYENHQNSIDYYNF